MFNVRLAGGHLYGKQLFTWLSLVMSMMASFVLSFFPLDVLDEIWDLIESVSEGFFYLLLNAGLGQLSTVKVSLSVSSALNGCLFRIRALDTRLLESFNFFFI